MRRFRHGACLALTFSLLAGAAIPVQAQSAARHADPLRENVPLPPLSSGSPYGGGAREGVYVLPGSTALPGGNRPPLPPLPPREKLVPAKPRPAPELPSPKRLSAPAPQGVANPENHRAETPASLRYIRPSVSTRQPVYPRPQPAPAATGPLPPLQPQTPATRQETAPAAIPFGQPSAPPRQEPNVTIDRAIPVEPQWQPVPPAPVPAPQPLEPQTPVQPTEPLHRADDIVDEFNAITGAADATPPPVPPVDVPLLPIAANATPAPLPDPLEDIVPPAALSEESRRIISKTPSGIDTRKTVVRSPEPVVIKRTDPNAGLTPKLDVRTHEAMGLKIEIRRPDVNIQSYLEQGYENLIAGREAVAAGYYQEALNAEPKNEMALFGLATTYQRMGRLAEARELYGKLLAVNPTHREGLNNFMALISREAPQEAIEELEKLETENPDFSPIPAQLGIVYNKIDNPRMAARKLARALNLSPDNLSYKYNLAITLDRLGQVEQASDLYLELIEAYNNGAVLPGNVEDLRNRVISINRKG